jgi:polar amino acid transport system substrate-binding protein
MQRTKLGFAIGAWVLVSIGAAWAQPTVKAAYAPFGPPLSSLPGATADNYRTLDPNGSMAQGALIDLINALAKDAGLQVRFVTMPVSDQIEALNSKNIDLAMMLPINQSADVDYTDPIYTDGEALLVKKSDGKRYTTWQDLKGEVIVAFKGSAFAEAAQKSGIFKEIRLVTAGRDVSQAVRNPEIKAGFKGSVIDTLYEQQHGVYEPDVQMSMSYQPTFILKRGFGSRKGDAILSKINASLIKLKSDGTVKTMFAKYGIDSVLVK